MHWTATVLFCFQREYQKKQEKKKKKEERQKQESDPNPGKEVTHPLMASYENSSGLSEDAANARKKARTSSTQSQSSTDKDQANQHDAKYDFSLLSLNCIEFNQRPPQEAICRKFLSAVGPF